MRKVRKGQAGGKAKRGKKRGPYVFPKRKAYPIGSMADAKNALVFSTWPDNKGDADRVRKAVFKRYPKLKKWFKGGKYAAESFEAEKGNPKKTTSTIYARFYVGHENDKGELQGNGKFKKFADAKAKAEQVAKKDGNSWVVSPRGVALWTHDGDGLFQVGHITAEAKKFYNAESYLDAEDAHFSRWEAPDNPLEVFYASMYGYGGREYDKPLTPARPSDPLPSRRRRPKRPWKAEGNSDSIMSMGVNVALFSVAAYVGYQFFQNTTKE